MKKNILGLVFTINRKIKIPYYLQYETKKDYCETFLVNYLSESLGKGVTFPLIREASVIC